MFHQLLIIFISILLSKQNAGEEVNDKWKGTWFPNKPGESDGQLVYKNPNQNDVELVTDEYHRMVMGKVNELCDDGKTNLQLDYDPNNIKDRARHICLENKLDFWPNSSIQPIYKEYEIPPAYRALHRCANVSIEYDYRLPTFGTHRPIWPIYGEYIYVPPQRWIHNLEHGAVVMLYHPCAYESQINKLKSLVKKCLFRYVISATDLLETSRPLALLTWGKSFEMSLVEPDLVIEFIRTNALKGPEQISRQSVYRENLIAEAEIVTTKDDEVLCPNM